MPPCPILILSCFHFLFFDLSFGCAAGSSPLSNSFDDERSGWSWFKSVIDGRPVGLLMAKRHESGPLPLGGAFGMMERRRSVAAGCWRRRAT